MSRGREGSSPSTPTTNLCNFYTSSNSRVTQWSEYFTDNEEVDGSNPSTTTNTGMYSAQADNLENV